MVDRNVQTIAEMFQKVKAVENSIYGATLIVNCRCHYCISHSHIATK